MRISSTVFSWMCVIALVVVFSVAFSPIPWLGPLWVTGVIGLLVLGRRLPTWQRIAQSGTWNAERDQAAWRFRTTLVLMGVVAFGLVTVTLVSAFSGLI